MIFAQNILPQVILNPISLTNGATGTSSVLDTIGYDYLTLLAFSGTADVVSNSPTVLELDSSDITNSTGYAAVAAFTGGAGAGNFTIPNMPTAATPNPYLMLNVDLRGQKRYFKWKVSPRTTQIWGAMALLTRAAHAPVGDQVASLQSVSGIVVTG